MKDRIVYPGQNAVLDAGYSSVYLGPENKEDSEEGEDGDGDERASFSLDTPEPAIPGPVPGGKVKTVRRRPVKRAGSPTAIDFAKTVYETAGTDSISTGMQIGIDSGSLTDVDLLSNEFIDQQSGLMNILFSPGERPWEDENLPAAERMALMKVIRTNFPDAQQRAEREEFEYRIRARSWGRSANVAPVVAAVSRAEQHESAPVIRKRESSPVQDGVMAIAREIRLEVPATPFIREYEPHNLDRNRNTALGMGSIIGMPPSLAMVNIRGKSQAHKTPVHYLGLAELVASEIQAGTITLQDEAHESSPVQKSWNPLVLSRDTGFVAALNKIYRAIIPAVLTNVTPYRKAVWEDKLLEQKENVADIVRVVPQSSQTPSPFADREVKMNIGIPALG